MVVVVILASSLLRVGGEQQDRLALDVNSAATLAQANFALDELKKLSDSRVYSTLSLSKILSAHQEDGIFHENTILKLELASPYYKSGNASETYEMIIMRHKEDGSKSLAIDEFPVMHDFAIEEFWIEKVKEKKIAREEAFRRLEIESLLMEMPEDDNEEWDSYKLPENIERKASIDKESVSSLLELLDTDALLESRLENSLKLRKQLRGRYLDLEIALSSLPLQSLYEITVDPSGSSTDFEVYRATQLVDASILELQKRKMAKRVQQQTNP